MKLYVHCEEPHAGTTWTKRLTVAAPHVTTVAEVVCQVSASWQAKFHREMGIGTKLYTERNQDPTTRRAVARDRYQVTLDQLGITGSTRGAAAAVEEKPGANGASDIELVLVIDSKTKPLGSAGGSASNAGVASASVPSTASALGSTKSTAESTPTTNHPRTNSYNTNASHPRPELTPPRPHGSPHPPPASRVGDPKLRGVLDLAFGHLKARRYRAAREAYENLVLRVDPVHPEALLGVGEIYTTIEKYQIAITRYFKKCWLAHHEHPKDKAYALMAFSGGLKVAECHVHLRQYRASLTMIDELQVFLRKHSKCRGYFNDPVEKERMEAQMDFLRASALYDMKSPAEQETAISLLMHMLPDLQHPKVNLDALQLYARVAHDRGKKNEALSMILRVLVGRSGDRSVRKQLVDLLKGKNGIERLYYSVPATTPSAAAAYAFTATILKDFGAVEASVRCFDHALSLSPSSASYALNHAHALVVCNRYREAYDALVKFFRLNPELTVDGLINASDILDALDEDGWDFKSTHEETETSMKKWTFKWQEALGEQVARVFESGELYRNKRPLPDSTQLPPSSPEAELDLLACFFAIVKILFVNGRLHALPRLIGLLEPIRFGRQLHKTTIRNEQAYYACIAQLMCIQPSLKLPTVEEKKDECEIDQSAQSIYVCGDSHTLAMAWREIRVEGRLVQLRPALVTGLKHYHLRKDFDFYPKNNFWNVVSSLPLRSRVIFNFGEIDCREGILQAVEMCKYETIGEGMQHSIGIFMDALTEVVEKYQFEVFIHPVVPVLNETRSLVIEYNRYFKERVDKSPLCRWLDFFEDLIEGTNPVLLRRRYAMDGTHLNPCYLPLLERELNKHIAPH